ncbi:MAG TPA: hypothetical protein VG602_10725 [Actinomycetota bacterium]|nr:hypothetical protein [Actinomycetota bacterium]
MGVFLILGVLAGFSFGIYLLPLPPAMALGLLIWKRPALLAGSLAAYVTFFWTLMYTTFVGRSRLPWVILLPLAVAGVAALVVAGVQRVRLGAPPTEAVIN